MTNKGNKTSSQVQFIASHQPSLVVGDYTITVEQHIQIPAKSVDQTFPLKQEQKFSVLGPRFTLDPQDIRAVFPPAGSLGEHSNVLPHIILRRSTLPWERRAAPLSDDEEKALAKEEKSRTENEKRLAKSGNEKKKIPWLALLLFDERDVTKKDILDQIKTPNSWKLSELPAATVNLPRSTDPGVTNTNYKVHFPNMPPEFGDHKDDAVAVIDVPKSLLSEILPSKEEFKFLAHVRQTTDADGNPQGDEVAVIICNRLPKSGSTSIAHLVSLEGRYNNSGFDFQQAKDDDLIRLVSLYSWRFACVSERHSFKGLLMQLNHQMLFNLPIKVESDEVIDYLCNINDMDLPVPDRLNQALLQSDKPIPGNVSFKDQSAWKINDGSKCYFVSKNTRKIYDQAGRDTNKSTTSVSDAQKVRSQVVKLLHLKKDKAKITEDKIHWWLGIYKPEYFLSKESTVFYVYHLDPDSASTLRLPSMKNKDETVNETAELYFAMGCAPLPHDMRQGNKSVSWYHGPLIPGTKTVANINLPIRSADELVLYNSKIGMFDVSYCAAWELGRLLTLQNKRVSLDLFNWKHSHAQSIKDAEGQLDHLPFDTPTALDLPESVRTWFKNLALLKGLPFNYLVPDERMLPTESIRFFQVDNSWVECLLDGAFSIGRVLSKEHNRDSDLSKHLPGEKKMSGFLLRSDVVSGWPGLLVDGYIFIEDKNREIFNKISEMGIPDELQNVFQGRGLSLPKPLSVMKLDKDSWQMTDQNKQLFYTVFYSNNQMEVKIRLLRMDRLSKNVLLCLFEGLIQAIDIHLKPETLHFGVSEGDDEHLGNDDKPVKWYKTLRDNDGKELTGWVKMTIKDNNAINIADLAKETNSNNSAQFALQMIEGVQSVRFKAHEKN